MLKEMLGEEETAAAAAPGPGRIQAPEPGHGALHPARQPGRKPRLQKFFNDWIYTRKLPRVRYEVAINGQSPRSRSRQEDSDFVFPVTVSVSSAEGKYAPHADR